ncbi:response regulator [Paenibacillus sp. MSJ-34]|uniref:response regulator n=1 Tax=Paenibacillus sp. MSJ-34 TaxID=2841529 RepID=UPI001C119F87|nr:response regulator [Paenibacillus sp. MSJ-34]MBU5441645.1 response regulator [Paenibacillus sp. MSJ-34]
MYRILIVDDEPIILKGLQVLIQQSELPISSIRMAANGQEALERMEEELPDFIFSDVRMPVMDGLELCKRIQEMDADVQTVVISGYGDFEYARQCVGYGVKEYLLKPVSKGQLHELLAKLAKGKSKRRQSGYLSIAKMDRWLEQFEQAVYFLEKDTLERLLDEWEQEIEGYQLQRAQYVELVEQFDHLLMKKLKARSVNIAVVPLQLRQDCSAEAACKRFRDHISETFRSLEKMRKGKVKDPVEEAKLYIEQNLRSEVSLEEVADMIGIHPNYFSLLFKQMTGETFIQYRIRCRMNQAKKMLGMQHIRITDISYEVGYADHSHFTKMFKKMEGLSPSEYRMKKLGIQ